MIVESRKELTNPAVIAKPLSTNAHQQTTYNGFHKDRRREDATGR